MNGGSEESKHGLNGGDGKHNGGGGDGGGGGGGSTFTLPEFVVFPVCTWSGGSGPLNALRALAAEKGCAELVTQSLRVTVPCQAYALLAGYLGRDTLCAGAYIPGSAQVFKKGGPHSISLATVPRSDLCVWAVHKLSYIGFVPRHPGAAITEQGKRAPPTRTLPGGVVEAQSISLRQHLMPDHSLAALVRLPARLQPRVPRGGPLDGAGAREAWRGSMRSCGVLPGSVLHVDSQCGEQFATAVEREEASRDRASDHGEAMKDLAALAEHARAQDLHQYGPASPGNYAAAKDELLDLSRAQNDVQEVAAIHEHAGSASSSSSSSPAATDRESPEEHGGEGGGAPQQQGAAGGKASAPSTAGGSGAATSAAAAAATAAEAGEAAAEAPVSPGGTHRHSLVFNPKELEELELMKKELIDSHVEKAHATAEGVDAAEGKAQSSAAAAAAAAGQSAVSKVSNTVRASPTSKRGGARKKRVSLVFNDDDLRTLEKEHKSMKAAAAAGGGAGASNV